MATNVSWIKISTEIFDNEKIKQIDVLPERDGVLVIWFKLLVLAGKSDNDGVFVLANRIPYNTQMLAAAFNRPLASVQYALAIFERYHMIEIVDGVITLPGWNDHQSLDKLEQARSKNAERQRRFRERQKLKAQTAADAHAHEGEITVIVEDAALPPEDILSETAVQKVNLTATPRAEELALPHARTSVSAGQRVNQNYGQERAEDALMSVFPAQRVNSTSPAAEAGADSNKAVSNSRAGQGVDALFPVIESASKDAGQRVNPSGVESLFGSDHTAISNETAGQTAYFTDNDGAMSKTAGQQVNNETMTVSNVTYDVTFDQPVTKRHSLDKDLDQNRRPRVCEDVFDEELGLIIPVDNRSKSVENSTDELFEELLAAYGKVKPLDGDKRRREAHAAFMDVMASGSCDFLELLSCVDERYRSQKGKKHRFRTHFADWLGDGMYKTDLARVRRAKEKLASMGAVPDESDGAVMPESRPCPKCGRAAAHMQGRYYVCASCDVAFRV